LKNRYEENNDEIIQLEEKSQFFYFEKFFQNFFAIKDIDSKIKKCHFELKNCFSRIGLINEAVAIIEKCYKKYPDDIVVAFEMLKQSIIVNFSIKKCSNFVKAEEIFSGFKKLYIDTTDNETLKSRYENYMNFSE
jgi:hypothetical protein